MEKRKELKVTNTHPKYETPKVTTYRREEIVKRMGTVRGGNDSQLLPYGDLGE
jgi:hypothetical protein